MDLICWLCLFHILCQLHGCLHLLLVLHQQHVGSHGLYSAGRWCSCSCCVCTRFMDGSHFFLPAVCHLHFLWNAEWPNASVCCLLRDAIKGERAERIAAETAIEHGGAIPSGDGPSMQVRGKDVPVIWDHPLGWLLAIPRTLSWDVRSTRKSSVSAEEHQVYFLRYPCRPVNAFGCVQALRQAFQEVIQHIQDLVEAGVPLEVCRSLCYIFSCSASCCHIGHSR